MIYDIIKLRAVDRLRKDIPVTSYVTARYQAEIEICN